jgi:hypothetical protein
MDRALESTETCHQLIMADEQQRVYPAIHHTQNRLWIDRTEASIRPPFFLAEFIPEFLS